MYDHSNAAKAIRKELKAKYPAVKFSVTSSIYTGGSSVNVRYEDGPRYSEVSDLVKRYEYGSFDSTTDYYSNDNVIADLPQVKYVLVHRGKSDQVTETILQGIRRKWLGAETVELNDWLESANCYVSEMVHREFSKTAFV